jgi:hypothetical protein
LIAKDSIELIREIQRNEAKDFCLVEKILLRIGQDTSHLDMEADDVAKQPKQKAEEVFKRQESKEKIGGLGTMFANLGKQATSKAENDPEDLELGEDPLEYFQGKIYEKNFGMILDRMGAEWTGKIAGQEKSYRNIEKVLVSGSTNFCRNIWVGSVGKDANLAREAIHFV